MAEADSSHYEISVRMGSRWEIHARYPVSQKDAAIEEARALERSLSAQVKVSRETFDHDAGLYKEIIIYRTAGSPGGGGPAAKPASRDRGARDWSPREDDDDGGFGVDKDGFFKFGAGNEEEEEDDDFEEKPRRKPKPKAAGQGGGRAGSIALRVFLITLLSFLVSGGITWALSGSKERLEALRKILGFAAHTDVLVSIFLGMFILSFVALALVLLSDFMSMGPRIPPAQAKPAAAPAAPPPAKVSAKEQAAGEWLEGRKPEKASEPEAAEKEEESHWEATPMPPDEPEKGKPEPEAREEEEPPLPPPAEEPPSEAPTEEVLEFAVSEAAQAQKRLLDSFMKMLLQDLVKVMPKVDTFNRFGVSLFLAGAVESLANDKGLPREETSVLLREAIELVGTPADQAAKFAETYENYLLTPRYMEMFESGRLSVNCFLEGDREGAERLGPALRQWNNPKKDEHQQSGTQAVMFTDMVGSTNLNQEVGDAAAQTVVHTHNRIVRGVLSDYYGREVKHTGDGIMAAFGNTTNAVKAGIVIMKRVAANNRAQKDIPLTLRIGINVGEPIQENNDLFGVTVQMAARLCAAAQPEQVLVSEAVKVMCAGKDIKFVERGTRLLKGIPDPVAVYEPLWEANPAPQQPPQTMPQSPQAPAK